MIRDLGALYLKDQPSKSQLIQPRPFCHALVLIPCSEQKNVAGVQGLGQPFMNIQNLRNRLLQIVQLTPNLADRPENLRGILNPNAVLTRAIDLYKGRFYAKGGNSLRAILSGSHPSTSVTIVSAFYGLVKLDEDLKEYDLKMGDTLHNGMKVYEFWQQNQLWQILLNHITQNSITHVWSLLPDSLPDVPYHRVFNQLWRVLRNTQVQCFHAEVLGAGSGTGFKRAEWLNAVLNANPQYLVGMPFPPVRFPAIPRCTFNYARC